MTILTRCIFCIAIVATLSCVAAENDVPDMILVGGRIISPGAEWMPDPSGSEELPTGIAISNGRVMMVGPSERVWARSGPETRVIDLGGRSVLPGLADNHLHSIGGGSGVDLSSARSLEDISGALAARAGELPPGSIIVSNSDWHEGQLLEQRLPYRDDLDRMVPLHPVVVVRGGHEYILNSLALEYWGVDETAAEVPGGRIGRYADGRLNGELVDRAKDLISLPPPRTRAAEAEALDALQAQYGLLNQRGLTSVRHPGGSLEQLAQIRELEEAGRLSMRVEFLFRAPRSASPEAVEEAIDSWTKPQRKSRLVQIGGVKLGVDGGFEGGLMRDAYEGPWGNGGRFYGLQTVPTEDFYQSVSMLADAGWRIATHAVGDAAIDLVLDAYAEADAKEPIAAKRWVIEHGFIPRPDQFDRMLDMGLAVSAQNHLYLAAPSLAKYWGAERAAWTTPLREYIDAGVPVSLGTDAPVVPYDPWWVLHHFTTRSTISAGVFGEDQVVSRLEALEAMTLEYAWLTFSEAERGTLDVGKLADLVVTQEDYLRCEDPCLESMKVDLTLLEGRVVWER